MNYLVETLGESGLWNVQHMLLFCISVFISFASVDIGFLVLLFMVFQPLAFLVKEFYHIYTDHANY